MNRVYVSRHFKCIPKNVLLGVILIFAIVAIIKSLNSPFCRFGREIKFFEKVDEWKLDEANVPKLSVLVNKTVHRATDCAKFPDLYTIHFSNIHWQVQETKSETYYLYSAYLDIRGSLESNAVPSALVRVLGMSDVSTIIQYNSSLRSCQFWFENSPTPKFTDITEIRMIWEYWWNSDAHYFPYLITCELPGNLHESPISVSLAPSKCSNATNNLKIVHKEKLHLSQKSKMGKPSFAVCVKAMDFPDSKFRTRLIEWIETMRVLGADKIFFYEYYVNPEIKRVLNYYEKLGVIDVTQTSLPGVLPNQAQMRNVYLGRRKMDKRTTELIPYNDCLYRNLYDYKYIAVMDTDEIILPLEENTWPDLMDQLFKFDIQDHSLTTIVGQPITTICFENFYFMDRMMDGKENEILYASPEFHMMRHIYRAKNSTKRRFMKCFHSTQETLGVHNHFAFFCRHSKKCNIHYVDEKRAQMNHYRSTCVKAIRNCSVYVTETVKDTKLWKYKNKIINRVETVFRDLEIQ